MTTKKLDAVTGAFGYTGKYIATQLLSRDREVITLTSKPLSTSPFGERVQPYPFNFDQPDQLAANLQGVDTLYNTYWVRFNHGSTTFQQAVDNTRTLIRLLKRLACGVSYMSASPTPAWIHRCRTTKARPNLKKALNPLACPTLFCALRWCLAARTSSSTTSPGCCAASLYSPYRAMASTSCSPSTWKTWPAWPWKPEPVMRTRSSMRLAPKSTPSTNWPNCSKSAVGSRSRLGCTCRLCWPGVVTGPGRAGGRQYAHA